MASIELLIPATSNITGNWINSQYALTSDAYSALSIDTVSPLIITNYEDVLPDDYSVDGVEVSVIASSVTATTDILVCLTNDASSTVGSYSITGLTTTPSTTVLGGATDTWGLLEVPSNFIKGNANFGVKVYRTGAENVYIQYIKIKIYYTTATSTLTGTSSVFPMGVDTFPAISNGVGLAHQVKSSDVNLLGDALFNIERVVAFGDGNVIVSNAGTLVFHVMEFSAVVDIASSTVCLNFYSGLTSVDKYPNANIGAVTISDFPEENINFTHAKVMCYLDTGAAYTALYGTASIMRTASHLGGYIYHLSLNFNNIATAPSTIIRYGEGPVAQKTILFSNIATGTIKGKVQLIGVI